ncbi:DUF92 domain-containing protein [Exiguobacterium sp. SH3S2]|uniref:DUF92 domain-containing protein n=1 Tax=unclassified Exiguobacterium TaxID=2644629 RepID=UPI00103E9BA1|nr:MULTISPECIES: DUF92 domain-containing protein [unclassified Exiguobacterium]TCI46270.1 DUF92 domain-containing protein [Exiguobacterium sp. SH3S3]TCI61911.1 DUF92 domain-containing protein [Exiguobacterium sp. SH3S2]
MLSIVLVTCLVALAGYRLRSLTFSGAILTIVTGTVIGFGFGWFGLYLLGVFFSTSSLASKYRARDKASVDDIVEKSGPRDFVQVLANGGIAMLTAIGMAMTSNEAWLFAYVVSIAAATSDTWGSEFGVLASRRPRSVLTLREVEPGTSGGVSPFGTLMSIAGATIIVLASLPFLNITMGTLFLLIALGLSGSVVDTLLGATVQRKYRCRTCRKLTEKKLHHGEATDYVSGWRFLGNDAVNFLAIASAAAIGFLVFA